MATIVLRNVIGRPLSIEEADANFSNLNTELGQKVNTSSYTASDILSKLDANDDGTGRELNAEFVQGYGISTSDDADTLVLRDSSANITVNNINAATLYGNVQGNVIGNLTGSVTGNATNVTGTVDISNGGTGATTAEEARLALGIGTAATVDLDSIEITGGSITGITDLSIADGGTGASNATAARTNLGLVIGQDVQPFSNTLTAYAAVVGNGIFVKTGSGTAEVRKITASTNLSITNGDGVSGNIAITGTQTPTVSSITKTGTNGVGDIGQTGNRFGTIYGTATSAKYADLAEKYLADEDYEVGTVVKVGGDKEVTAASVGSRVLGVVSENPAYCMNDELEGGTYIALKGRVPVKVVGKINKGDELVATENGHAYAPSGDTTSMKVFGIALETKTDNLSGVIEAVIL